MRRADETKLVAQPLNGAAGVEHAAFEGIGGLAVNGPRNTRDQTADAAHGLAAGVHEREAARTIGVLRLTRLDARLTEQRSRLVAGAAADGHALERLQTGQPGRHLSIDHRGRHRRRQHAHRDAQTLAELLIPAQTVNIKQHRTRAVGIVRHVRASAGEVPDEPRVHIAEQQVAALGALSCTRDIVQDPLDLRAGEISIDEQPGLLLHVITESVRHQLVADGRRAAALPDDCIIDRSAGVLVPDDGRLALVRDADAGDVRRRQAALFKCLAHGEQLALEDDHRVMLDPARFRIDLREWILRQRYDVSLTIEDNRAGTGCTLIKCNDVAVHNENNLRRLDEFRQLEYNSGSF